MKAAVRFPRPIPTAERTPGTPNHSTPPDEDAYENNRLFA
jgi:hypothetical protein